MKLSFLIIVVLLSSSISHSKDKTLESLKNSPANLAYVREGWKDATDPEVVSKYAQDAGSILNRVENALEEIPGMAQNSQVFIIGGSLETLYSYAHIFGTAHLRASQFSFLPFSRATLRETTKDPGPLNHYLAETLKPHQDKTIVFFDTILSGETLIALTRMIRTLNEDRTTKINAIFFDSPEPDFKTRRGKGILAQRSLTDYLASQKGSSEIVQFLNLGSIEDEQVRLLHLPRLRYGKYHFQPGREPETRTKTENYYLLQGQALQAALLERQLQGMKAPPHRSICLNMMRDVKNIPVQVIEEPFDINDPKAWERGNPYAFF